jgi:hypothetical protein
MGSGPANTAHCIKPWLHILFMHHNGLHPYSRAHVNTGFDENSAQFYDTAMHLERLSVLDFLFVSICSALATAQNNSLKEPH